ncbi:unnamed protein product [Amoebophrya sp. A120]|nr:unnamed protein product [Amoebophrya sp. A120]|eukprot:GSA120T00002305001.1
MAYHGNYKIGFSRPSGAPTRSAQAGGPGERGTADCRSESSSSLSGSSTSSSSSVLVTDDSDIDAEDRFGARPDSTTSPAANARTIRFSARKRRGDQSPATSSSTSSHGSKRRRHQGYLEPAKPEGPPFLFMPESGSGSGSSSSNKPYLAGVLAIKCGASLLREFGFTGWKQRSIDKWNVDHDINNDPKGTLRSLFGIELDWSKWPRVALTAVDKDTRAAKAGLVVGDMVATIADVYVITDVVRFVPKSSSDPVPQSPDAALLGKLRQKVKEKNNDPSQTSWGFVFHRKKKAENYLNVEILDKNADFASMFHKGPDGKKTMLKTSAFHGVHLHPSGLQIEDGDELLVAGDKFCTGREDSQIVELLKTSRNFFVHRPHAAFSAHLLENQHSNTTDIATHWAKVYAPLNKGKGGSSSPPSATASRAVGASSSTTPAGGGEKVSAAASGADAPFLLSVFGATQSADSMSSALLYYEQKMPDAEELVGKVSKMSSSTSSAEKILLLFGFELDWATFPNLRVVRVHPTTPRARGAKSEAVTRGLKVGDRLLVLGGERTTSIPKMEGSSVESAVLNFLARKVKKYQKVMFMFLRSEFENEFIQVHLTTNDISLGLKISGSTGEIKEDPKSGTFGAKCHLKAKDQLLIINDKPPRKHKPEELAPLLSSKGHRPLSLLVRRRGGGGFDSAALTSPAVQSVLRSLPSNWKAALEKRKTVPPMVDSLDGGPAQGPHGAAAGSSATGGGQTATGKFVNNQSQQETNFDLPNATAAASIAAAKSLAPQQQVGAAGAQQPGLAPAAGAAGGFQVGQYYDVNAIMAGYDNVRSVDDLYTADQLLRMQNVSDMQRYVAEAVDPSRRMQGQLRQNLAAEHPSLGMPVQPFTGASQDESSVKKDTKISSSTVSGQMRLREEQASQLYVTSYLQTLEQRGGIMARSASAADAAPELATLLQEPKLYDPTKAQEQLALLQERYKTVCQSRNALARFQELMRYTVPATTINAPMYQTAGDHGGTSNAASGAANSIANTTLPLSGAAGEVPGMQFDQFGGNNAAPDDPDGDEAAARLAAEERHRRPIPPSINSLTQKDGLDITFMHLRSQGERLQSVTGELSRKVTQALNEMTAQQLLDANFITQNERDMIADQEQKRMEQERYKAELQEQVRDEQQAQFYAERHSRNQYYESMYAIPAAGGAGGGGGDEDEPQDEDDTGVEVDPEDVVVVPVDPTTGELQIPKRAEKAGWQEKLDQDADPTPILINANAMKAERQEIRNQAIAMNSPLSRSRDHESRGNTDLQANAISFLGSAAGAAVTGAGEHSRGDLGPQVDVDVHALEKIANLFRLKLTDVAASLRVCTDTAGDPTAWRHYLRGEPLDAGQREAVISERRFATISSSFDPSLVPFYRRLFFPLDKKKCADPNDVLWFHIVFYEKAADGSSVSPDEQRPTGSRGKTLHSRRTTFDETDPLAQVSIRVRNGELSGKVHAVQPIWSRKSKRLVQAFGSDAVLRARCVVRDSRSSAAGARDGGMSPMTPGAGRGRSPQGKSYLPQSWNDSAAQSGEAVASQYGIVERVKAWDASGKEEIVVEGGGGMVDSIRENHFARDAEPLYDEYLLDQREHEAVADQQRLQEYRGITAAAEARRRQKQKKQKQKSAAAAGAGGRRGSVSGAMFDAGGSGKIVRSKSEALLEGEDASDISSEGAEDADALETKKRKDLEDEEKEKKKKKGPTLEELAKRKLEDPAERVRLEDIVHDRKDEERVRQFMKKEAAEELMKLRSKRDLGADGTKHAGEAIQLTPEDKLQLRQTVKAAGQAEMRRLKAERAQHGRVPLRDTEVLEVAIEDVKNSRKDGRAEFLFYPEDDVLAQERHGTVEHYSGAGQAGQATSTGVAHKHQPHQADLPPPPKPKKTKPKGVFSCFDSSTDDEAEAEVARQTAAMQRLVGDQHKLAHKEDFHPDNLTSEQNAVRDQLLENQTARPRVPPPEIDILETIEAGEIPPVNLLQQCAQHAHNQHMEELEERQVLLGTTFEHYDQHLKDAATSPLLASAGMMEFDHEQGMVVAAVNNQGAGGSRPGSAIQAAVAGLPGTASKMSVAGSPGLHQASGSPGAGRVRIDDQGAPGVVKPPAIFLGGSTKADQERAQRLQRIQMELRERDLGAQRNEESAFQIQHPKELKLPPKIQWVGIPLPHLRPLEPDLGACLIEDFDLELLPDKEDALDFHQVLEKLRSLDTVYETLEFQSFKRFRYTIGELYSTLFQLQHDGRLGTASAAAIKPGSSPSQAALQKRRDMQSQAQLVLEYAIALAREPRLPYGSLASQLITLLLDCLRRFPRNPWLHYWGIDALLNLMRQQKHMDIAVKAEREKVFTKQDLRMVKNALLNPKGAPYMQILLLADSLKGPKLGLAMWAQSSLNAKVIKDKKVTWRQKLASLFGMALDFTKFPQIRVTKVVEQDVMDPTKPSRAFKAKVGKGDLLLKINDRPVTELVSWPGQDPHEAIVNHCVKQVTAKKKINFWFLRLKFESQYLQLEIDRPDHGLEMDFQKYFVRRMAKKGWAESRGLKKGDRVIAIGRTLCEFIPPDKGGLYQTEEALEASLQHQMDITGPRPLSVLFRRGEPYTREHYKNQEDFTLQLPQAWREHPDVGKKVPGHKDPAVVDLFHRHELRDSYDPERIPWNRMLFFPEPAKPPPKGQGKGKEGKKGPPPRMKPYLLSQLARGLSPKEAGVVGWQVEAKDLDVDALHDPHLSSRDKFLHLFGFQLYWKEYPLVRLLRAEKLTPRGVGKTQAYKFKLVPGDVLLLFAGHPISEIHEWPGRDPDDALIERVIHEQKEHHERQKKDPKAAQEHPQPPACNFMFLRKENFSEYVQVEVTEPGHLGFEIANGHELTKEDQEKERDLHLRGGPASLPNPEDYKPPVPPAAGSITQIEGADCWAAKNALQVGDRLVVSHCVTSNKAAHVEKDFSFMAQKLDKFYSARPLHFLFRRTASGGFSESMRKALQVKWSPSPLAAAWMSRIRETDKLDKDLKKETHLATADFGFAAAVGQKPIINLNQNLAGRGSPFQGVDGRHVVAGYTLHDEDVEEKDAKKAAKDLDQEVDQLLQQANRVHVDSSVPVPEHRHQFQMAVFHSLHVPMRIEEEMLQWKVLDALAECIHPECLIVQDHLDFALDLVEGKERIARRLEAEDRTKRKKTQQYRNLLDEVVAIDSGAGAANNSPGGRGQEEFWTRYKSVAANHRELNLVSSTLAEATGAADDDGANQVNARQERQRFLTLSSYESLFEVLLVCRSAHRVLEQHAYCLRALLRFKASPRLLVRALLVLGNIYELTINHLGNDRLLLRPTMAARAETEENGGPHSTAARPSVRPPIQKKQLDRLHYAIDGNLLLVDEGQLDADLLLDDPSALFSSASVPGGRLFDFAAASGGFRNEDEDEDAGGDSDHGGGRSSADGAAGAALNSKHLRKIARDGADIRMTRNKGNAVLHGRSSSLLELLCQVLDLSPENRKVCGSTLRVIALLCVVSKAQIVHTAHYALRSVILTVKRHPDSQSVLKHALQIFHACALHDQRLGSSLSDVFRTLLTMGGLLKNDLESREYLVNTLRVLAEGSENIDEYEKPIAQSFLNMLDHFLVDEDTMQSPSVVVPCLETLALLSHENAVLRQYLLPGMKHPLRILNEDRISVSVQAKAANCVKVMAMAGGLPVLEVSLLTVLQENNGIATLLKAGKKYCSTSSNLCLELLSTFANLLFCTSVRDLLFGKAKREQSINFVEWVLVLLEENGVKDVDCVAQGFRLFGSLTRYEEDEATENEMVESFVLTEQNIKRLRLLVMNCLPLQDVGFDFLEKLARQQLAGRPMAGRILTLDGEVLLEEGPKDRENFWLAL